MFYRLSIRSSSYRLKSIFINFFSRITEKCQNNLKEQKSLIEPTIVKGSLCQRARLTKMYFKKLEEYAECCWRRPNSRTGSLVHVPGVQEYGDIFQECWRNILKPAATYFGHAECYWVWPRSEKLALLLLYL